MSKKYRPYLTLSEIQETIPALQSSRTPNTRLIRYLSNFYDEIILGERRENYSLVPSFISSLELDGLDPFQESGKSFACYQKWMHSPASCSPSELQLAFQYRYDKDMLTAEEEDKFEAQNGISFP